MPQDWNDEDRRAFKLVAVWFGLICTGAIVRGVVFETQNLTVLLGLSGAWLAAAIYAVIWSLRQRKGRGS